ncbi:MAG: VWA domain-containing protein [Candidatus Contendobacter sp.]|nr:VWA domain-containing protein [Candidatus Contendobacter sp.]MDG4559122.1 VWA domain-containing protein [Candidatus Contendobacter sp.]
MLYTTCIQSTRRPYTWPAFHAVILLAGSLSGGLANAQTTHEIDCQPGKVCREKGTLLPLRALPRPFSNLYKSKEAKDDNVLAANVKAFFPVYVFDRQEVDYTNPADPKGWYQVGSTTSQPLGWMQAKDVMEWRQALVVSYTHPGVGEEARKPVLMFNTKQALEAVVGAADRPEQANKLYEQIKNKQYPDAVISMEPNQFIDIGNKFYILPVLDYKVENRFDDETRLLQITAAVPEQRSNPGEKPPMGGGSDKIEGEAAKNLTADIVFVMDLTKSMGPYVDMTKETIAQLARTVTKDPEISKAVKFGIIGYRDKVELIPGLEFLAKNFTPTLLEDEQFVEVVNKEVKATSVDSKDYAEEVYAGVKESLTSTQWRPTGPHFLVLIGDASAHDPGHPQSTTNLDALGVRNLPEWDKNVYVFAIHLRDEKFKADWEIAERQFGTIATNDQSKQPALFPVDVTKSADFKEAADTISKDIAIVIADAKKKNMVDPGKIAVAIPVLSETGEATKPSTATSPVLSETGGGGAPVPPSKDSDMDRTIRQVIAGALISYLGTISGKPPRDVTFWAMDRDLVDPRKRALQVHLLINREDLSSLILALERVTDALATAELTQMKFFESLQAILGEAAKGQDINFEKAKKLAESNLLPKWIESLPYKSAILEMSDDKFEAMAPAERSELEKGLKAKLQLYKDISEKVDAWKSLSEQDQDANANKVYPLALDVLP